MSLWTGVRLHYPPAVATADGFEDRSLGRTTVLFGERGGRYPHGNSLLVVGSEETLIIDPSLGVIPRFHRLPRVDRVLNSHCHEDHIAGNHLFPEAPWHLHELDLPGIRSLDGLMAIYGFPEPVDRSFRNVVCERFHFTPRPDPLALRGGDVFQLGRTQVRVIHAPGHTRGHCFFHIEPDDILFLGDVELSSFGPYYGDAWSSLEDFEDTLRKAAGMHARFYATFHHVGVLEERSAFQERIARFSAVIDAREARLLDFLREPQTLEEIAQHRFVYRPQDQVSFAEAVERRSMGQHLERLAREGRVREVEPGTWLAS
ncbi:MAG TPA: MBL fold metallo-hydrolase [Deltaproteobacteria bacterium]|jgi:glyoxylase-like metal-dependent hydrolase (beta-lactamase superfamily II)|nr:MBL fold metallo-hydrolase [Deltaproteobacteria bacterium]